MGFFGGPLGIVLFLLIGIGLGAGVAFYVLKRQAEAKRATADQQAQAIVAQAEVQGQEVLRQSRDEALQFRAETEQELNRRRQGLHSEEERLQKRNNMVDIIDELDLAQLTRFSLGTLTPE